MRQTQPSLATQRSGSADGLPPPPMRNPHASCTPSIGSLLTVLVFLLGVMVGSKMVGGW